MLQISYRLTLACPIYVVLSQYYDYEHISTVQSLCAELRNSWVGLTCDTLSSL